MTRFFTLLLLSSGLGLTSGVQAQSLPARPQPFTFVTDQANLLAPADAKKLDDGLRRYADANGTQVVVVTVPSLGGRAVADYARELGTSWGVGQRGKNNGVVVLLSGQERTVSIQAGSGLQSAITPAVTSRIINQQMLPNFKQGNYFAGLRTGLNTLLLAANPASDPRRNAPAGTAPAGAGSTDNFPALGGADAPAANNSPGYETPATTPEPINPVPAAEPESSGPTMLTMLLGVLAVGGIGFLLLKMLRRNSAGSAAGGPVGGSGPDFYGNQPNRNNGGNYNNGPMNQGSSGPGIGGILATGAAAAAGAYLGNRMASGHDTDSAAHNYDSSGGAGLGAGLGAGAAGGNYSTPTPDSGPDYFSDTDSNSSADYFSSGDNSSYDDSSSGDTGGGGFDSTDDNSGSW